jgi:hypothetical protein
VKGVLPTEVGDKPVAMVISVVLNDQSLVGVVEVGAGNELSSQVGEFRLNARPR